MLLQAPEEGGEFIYSPELRTDDDPNYEGVERLLAGQDPNMRTITLDPGTLNIFRGKNSPHRVGTVKGGKTRVIAVFTFYENPGVRFTDRGKHRFLRPRVMTELAVFKDERKRTFLNAEGSDKPLKSPLGQDVLDRARAYRLQRLRDEMARQDVAGLLLYDPVNIRYAFDCSNMSIWTAHNPIRYALILNGGPGIMFEFKGCEHLNDGLPGIDEVRNAIGWMFMCAGDKAADRLTPWAAEIADLLKQYGGGNMRLGVDRMEPEGVHALSEHGLQILDGGQITETARAIKSADEIELMRWTIRVCEAGMARIYEHSVPGVTEQELWAHLHFENARSGGEWLETKLLTCGPNTNPWYKECSTRECRAGEMISFDTDMIGPYGYCADLSRSWTCGYVPMNDTQERLYAAARKLRSSTIWRCCSRG